MEESRRTAAAAPLSEEAELQRALAMSAQSYTAEQSQRKAYERYAAPAGAVRAPRHAAPPQPPASAAWLPSTSCGRGPNGPCPNGQREAKLAELARRPPAIQAAPDVARLMDELGLSHFLPLLLAEEAADMETLICLEAGTGGAAPAAGRAAKLLHALKREPGWRPRYK